MESQNLGKQEKIKREKKDKKGRVANNRLPWRHAMVEGGRQ